MSRKKPMETKDQFRKILEWMRQINRTISTMSSTMATKAELNTGLQRLNMRIDGLEERMDLFFEALQPLLKAVRRIRIEQYQDRDRFQREIQKIKQEIRQLMH